MKRKRTTIFRGRIIHPVSPNKIEELKDGALVVDADGRVIACGEDVILPRPPLGKGGEGGFKVVDKRGFLIIPGLVDCHSHLPQLDQRGKHGAALLDWLKKYIFPAEAAFKNLRVVDDVAKRFFKKLILNGTTTSAIYTTIHAASTNHVFEIAEAAGVRAIIGKVMMDQYSPNGLQESFNKSIADSERLYKKWHGKDGRLFYAFTPRFAPTCSKRLWKALGKIMEESNVYLQTHVAETREENERVHQLFPEYPDYVALFEDAGVLGPKTILAHAIYVSADECRRLAMADTKLVHCPTSNLFLKSGRMPIEMIEAAGIAYGLGTDVGAGTSMSLFTTMRHADYIQPEVTVSPRKAFYLATLGGAAVLSLDDQIGNFSEGKFADFNIVDITMIDPRYKPNNLSMDEILSLMMYRGDGRIVRETYVAGQKLDVDAIKIKGERNKIGYA